MRSCDMAHWLAVESNYGAHNRHVQDVFVTLGVCDPSHWLARHLSFDIRIPDINKRGCVSQTCKKYKSSQ